MSKTLQMKRGVKANLPTLSVGEPAFTTDTKELYIGTGSGNINVGSTIIGTTGINVISKTPVTIASGAETTFTHPSVADTNFMARFYEQVAGTSTTDTHVDFSSSSKYTLQDANYMSVASNKVTLTTGNTKLLMHMDSSSFTDDLKHTVTNTGSVSYNTSISKFGSGSACFSGSNYLTVANGGDFDFGTGNFTVDFWMYASVSQSNWSCLVACSSTGSSATGFQIVMLSNKIYLQVNVNGGTTSASGGTVLNNSSWNHIALVRNGSNFTVYVNGVSDCSLTNANSISTGGSNFYVGVTNDLSFKFTGGYIDELRVTKGEALWTTSFTPPTSQFILSGKTLYIKTTSTSDYSFSNTSVITSLTIPATIPAGSTVNCLFSVDGGTNWLYKDGTGIHIYTGDLTVAWTSYNSNTDLQTYFTNLSITQLTNDLSSLGIIPVSLDFCFQLVSSSSAIPSISTITLIYVTKPYSQLISAGGYDDSYTKLGVKRSDNSTLLVKNLSATSRTIGVNILINS